MKLFVLAMNSRRRCSISVCFIYGLEEKNSKSEVIFAVCRLPLTSSLTSLMLSPLLQSKETGIYSYTKGNIEADYTECLPTTRNKNTNIAIPPIMQPGTMNEYPLWIIIS